MGGDVVRRRGLGDHVCADIGGVMTGRADGAAIDLGTAKITLAGVAASDLPESDFLFG